MVISIGTKVENKSSTCKEPCVENFETEIKLSPKYQKNKNAMNIVKTEDNQSPNSLIKIVEEPNLYCVENKSLVIKPSKYYWLFLNFSNLFIEIYNKIKHSKASKIQNTHIFL